MQLLEELRGSVLLTEMRALVLYESSRIRGVQDYLVKHKHLSEADPNQIRTADLFTALGQLIFALQTIGSRLNNRVQAKKVDDATGGHEKIKTLTAYNKAELEVVQNLIKEARDACRIARLEREPEDDNQEPDIAIPAT